jgi:hypothetical protein
MQIAAAVALSKSNQQINRAKEALAIREDRCASFYRRTRAIVSAGKSVSALLRFLC